jgi:hypothetical protein
VLLHLGEILLDVSHELAFLKGDLLETESINNINNALGIRCSTGTSLLIVIYIR